MTTEDLKRWHGASHSKAAMTDEELEEALTPYPEPVREAIRNNEAIRVVFAALYVDAILAAARLNRFMADLGVDVECTNQPN